MSGAKSIESEVASYILAYLLQNNLKSSANAFLKECDVLPSKTFIVLPETPLHAVIAEHKARHNAKVLVNTLGSEPAWQELWSKLHTTLNQIRCLGEDLNNHHFQPTTKMKAQRASGEHGVLKAARQGSGIPPSASMSPRKRKLGSCRRIAQSSPTPSTPAVRTEPANPPSPTMQQVLDTFLDESFPGKLADIINQCVSSSDVCTEDISSEMSAETLERILNVTLSEPTLEGVFPPSSHLPSASSGDTPSTQYSTATTSTNLSTALASVSEYSPTPSASHYSAIPLPPSSQSAGPSTTSHYSAAASNTDAVCCEPHFKRLKPNQSQAELFPSEHDIDNFLDQIHQ